MIWKQHIDDCPAIRHNILNTAGAKTHGHLTVGDNFVIGADAVVLKNVPPNCTAVGAPDYWAA